MEKKLKIAKFFIRTFGCQMNFSDSERLLRFLENFSLVKTEDIEKADLLIINTCGVRQSAEDRVFGQIHNFKKENPAGKIILTRCLAYRPDIKKKLTGQVDLFCGIKNFVVEAEKFFQKKLNLKNKEKANWNSTTTDFSYLRLRPQYKYSDIAFVPIMTGCNNFCSYCVVPYARGREWSRPRAEIIREISFLNEKGYREVTLLGQNVNSYAGEVSFPNLLKELSVTFPKIIFKFLTSHPKDFGDDLIKVIKERKNIAKEIHLPLQSGSSKVLGDMNRPYTKEEYLFLVKKIKKNIPEVKLTTDIIIGFPTEDEKEFQETVKVFEKVKFAEVFFNKYSPRPGTRAEKLGDPVPWSEKKRREKVLREIVEKH